MENIANHFLVGMGMEMQFEQSVKTEIKQEFDCDLPLGPDMDSQVTDEPHLIDIKHLKQELKTENDEGASTLINEQPETNHDEKTAGGSKRRRKKAAADVAKVCEYCNMQFLDSNKLKRHVMGHTGERPFPCHLCDSAFKEKYNLSVHLKTHTGERNIPCPECDKTFIVQSALKAHMRTHSKEKPYVCNVCGIGFSHRANLKPHIATHSDEFPFMCQVCGKTFRMRKGLMRHIRSHHTNCKREGCLFCLKYMQKETERIYKKFPEKIRECPVCLQSFKYYTTYKNHLRMHNNENFSCNFCNKTYIDKASLRIHMRNHTGETPFECNICGKKFKRRDSHRYHLTTHNKEREVFYCDICNQGYTHKSSVSKHKRHVHYNERRFKCEICDFRFKTPEHLKGHLRTHSGRVPQKKIFVTCRICGKNLEGRGYTVHMKKHGIRIFRCRKCRATFESQELFNIHKESKCLVNGSQEEELSLDVATSENEDKKGVGSEASTKNDEGAEEEVKSYETY